MRVMALVVIFFLKLSLDVLFSVESKFGNWLDVTMIDG